MRLLHALGYLAISTTVCALLMVMPGCDALIDDPAPSTARIVLSGADGEQVRLVTSKRFNPIVEQGLGGTRVTVSVLDADTSIVTLPYEERFDIRIERRFFAEIIRLEVPDEEVVMQGFINGRNRYDRSGFIAEEDTIMQFIYNYNNASPGGGGET